jgi:hypothetical protein
VCLGFTFLFCILPFLCIAFGPGRAAVRRAETERILTAAVGGSVVTAVDPRTITDVKILGSRKDRAVAWKAEEAVKFSLDQAVTAIGYLFAAAAAGMAFIGKVVIEPHVSKESEKLAEGVVKLLLGAVVFWLCSLVCGMSAHLSLAELGTAQTFTIYEEFGWFVLFQLGYFAAGAVLFLAALIQV